MNGRGVSNNLPTKAVKLIHDKQFVNAVCVYLFCNQVTGKMQITFHMLHKKKKEKKRKGLMMSVTAGWKHPERLK